MGSLKQVSVPRRRAYLLGSIRATRRVISAQLEFQLRVELRKYRIDSEEGKVQIRII